MDIKPTERDFIELSKKYNLISLSYKFYADWLTPVSIYYSLSKILDSESFLLESIEGEEKICRFSFLGFTPLLTFKSKGKKIYIEDEKLNIFDTKRDPLFELKKLMSNFNFFPKESLRFFGGFVGYLGYDIIRFYEPVGKDLQDKIDTFDSYFILPKFLIVFDHSRRQVEILSFVVINNKDAKKVYRKEKEELEKLISNVNCNCNLSSLSFKANRLSFVSNFKKKDFISAVCKIKNYIKNGEIIQAVLSQNFSIKFSGEPFEVYRYLRILNPSPYMFYLNFKDIKLVGSSPEMLLRCENGELITRPIAGTRKRGNNEIEDKNLENSLIGDPKERAEHIMLVDLARNDLGRVAVGSSVSIPIFMSIERFSHVMHIVSEVRAKLKKGVDIFEALISCFPAGTVTGAPKVRAMQIINEFEPQKRGVYAGCVCYFSFTNSLDSCITIRTILFKDNKAYVQAGAGIVYDSEPLKEYQETLNKAKAQILALQYASRP